MGSYLETNKTPSNRPNNSLHHPWTTLGHGYFRSYLTRLPNYDSTRCECSEPVQTTLHLLLVCPLYKEERERAGIGRETTLQSLLFTPKGTAALIDVIQETRVATRRWLLQSARECDEEDTWGWGRLAGGTGERWRGDGLMEELSFSTLQFSFVIHIIGYLSLPFLLFSLFLLHLTSD